MLYIKQFFFIYVSVRSLRSRNHCSFGPSPSRALNLNLSHFWLRSLIGFSQATLKSLSAFFVAQTEPQILRLVNYQLILNFCAAGDDAARHRRGGGGDQGQDAVSQPPLRHGELQGEPLITSISHSF